MAIQTNASLYQDLTKILYSRQQIAAAVDAVGKRIAADYAGKDLLVVGILKGASVFFTDLIRAIDLPLSTEFMTVSSYGAGTTAGELRIIKDLDCSVAGRDLLIVEDIIDTGRTLNLLQPLLLGRGAASVRLCTLLNKTARRDPAAAGLVVDYVCFPEVPDEFVVGYGLDFNEKYRNLPDIGVLSPEKYR